MPSESLFNGTDISHLYVLSFLDNNNNNTLVYDPTFKLSFLAKQRFIVITPNYAE